MDTTFSPAETTQETVADIVRQYPNSLAVFKKLNIDFCCRGNRPFNQVCAEMGLDPAELLNRIAESHDTGSGIPARADEWSLNFLADYIVEQHHTYVRRTLPELLPLLNKVVNRHGKEHPELIDIQDLFEDVASELTMHMHKEEGMLFPAIKTLVQADLTGQKVSQFPFGSIQNPITMMEAEHIDAGDNTAEIRRLSNNFTVPSDACYSFQLLWQQLEEFETDLHQHVYLENNILFPKAIALEQHLS